MSVESIAAVLNADLPINPTAKLVLVGIANHDGDGGAWPSVATLARYAGVSTRSVQRALADLIEAGLIERLVNEGGTHRTPDHERPNLYRITLPRGVTPVSPPDAAVTGGVTPVSPPPLTEMSPHPLTPVSPEPSLEPSGETSLEPSALSRFDEWWDAYPRKVAKPAALRRWKAMSERDRQRAIAALAAWCAYWEARGEPEFIPHPTTWLNQERYNDPVPVHRPPRANTVASRNRATFDNLRGRSNGVAALFGNAIDTTGVES